MQSVCSSVIHVDTLKVTVQMTVLSCPQTLYSMDIKAVSFEGGRAYFHKVGVFPVFIEGYIKWFPLNLKLQYIFRN